MKRRPKYHISHGPCGDSLEPLDDAEGSLLGPDDDSEDNYRPSSREIKAFEEKIKPYLHTP